MTCVKCGTKLISGGGYDRSPSQHHVYPVRWFGKGKHNRMKILLCGYCHRELESIITGIEESIIAKHMMQQELSRRPGKRYIKRMFRSLKHIYLQIANDYIGLD